MAKQLADWTLMRFFLEVARAGSFAGARLPLGASQPTIGRRIDEFEAEVNTKVFIRTSQGVTLTPAGRRLFVVAEAVETLVRSVQVEATGEADLSGLVRCTVTDGIGGYWLPLMLEKFHEAHPHITLEVSVCNSGVMPNLSRREADITVVYRPPTDPDVCVLAEDVAVGMPMASRSYIEKHGQPRTLEELLAHRYCAHDLHFAEVGPWARLAGLLKRHHQIVYRSNSSLAVCQAVRRGLGISYMPIGVMDREPDLVFFDLEGYAPQMPFWLVCHRDVKDIPSVRAMVNYIKDTLFGGMAGSLSRRPVPLV
jgi:DNA-binding transcriptional LysR family regulator